MNLTDKRSKLVATIGPSKVIIIIQMRSLIARQELHVLELTLVTEAMKNI